MRIALDLIFPERSTDHGGKMNRIQKLSSLMLAAILAASGPVSVLATGAAPAATAEQHLQDGYSESENEYEIYPVPQSLVYENGTERKELQLTNRVVVVYADGVDQYTKNYLQEVLRDNGMELEEADEASTSLSTIVLGIHDDNSLADQLSTADDSLYEKTDAYALKVDDTGKGQIILTGKDADAVFYGISTLKMLLSSFAGPRLLCCEIEDYSATELRGFIEGFYGGFSYEARESQMRMLRDVKGNMFVFASKTDPYHGGNKWNELYPDSELNQIKHLVEVGKETRVRYTWSVHIGKCGFFNNASTTPGSAGYDTYRQRVQQLEAKFEQLYDAGVRDFHVLNDDYNSGSVSDVVTLLNELNAWRKEKGDVGPIVYCPNGYNTSWAGNFSELKGLKGLDEDIYLYWTGSQVNSPITQDNINVPYDQSGHYPVTWLNYPCSEHDKAGIYLGSIWHYVKDADGLEGQKGLLSNPVNYPEANKVAYFQLMSWAWNRTNYTDYMEELWEDSFKYLEPEAAESYLTLARNISSCPDSSRVTPFPESEYLKDKLDSVLAKARSGKLQANDEEAQALISEFENILKAADDFDADCTNAALKKELAPWISSLKAVVNAGMHALQAVMALPEGDLDTIWREYAAAGSALSLWDDYPTPEYPEKSAKAGSLRLQPFASGLLNLLNTEVMPLFNPDDEGFTYSIYSSYASANDANTAKMFDGNESTYASWNIVQKAGDYYGTDLGKVLTVESINIVQGETDTHHDRFHESVLEVSQDGQNWTTIQDDLNQSRISVGGLNVKARYIRLRVKGFTDPNTPGKSDFWTRVREFSVTTKEGAKPASILGDGQNLDASTITETSEGVTFDASALLAGGQSVGFRLKSLRNLSLETLPELPEGIKLQTSMNAIEWSDDQQGSFRYARLINTGSQDITLNHVQVSWSARMVKPSVTSNIGSLKEGSWDNLVDGDLSTNVWTSVNQAAGQTIQVDLKKTVNLDSVALFMSEQRPRLYHGIIRASEDGQTWRDIFTVDASNDDTVIENSMRLARRAADGLPARYLRIDITDSAKEEPTEHSAFLNLYELQVNGGSEGNGDPRFSGSPAGDFRLAADNNLGTFYRSVNPDGAGFLEMQITENNALDSLLILQDPENISNASVQIRTEKGYQTIGTLNKGATTFDLKEADPVLSVKISWDGNTPAPSLFEILPRKRTEVSDKLTVERVKSVYGPAVEKGTAFEDLGLPETMEAILSNGETRTYPVNWHAADYHANRPGLQAVSGVLQIHDEDVADTTHSISMPVRVLGVSERTNLALNHPVESSGHEVSDGRWRDTFVVDGDKTSDESRWSSGLMKQGTDAGQNQTEQTLTIDLGEGINTIESMTATFYRKVYAVDYEIWTSDDQENWTLQAEHQGIPESESTVNPEHTFTPEAPIQGRYVKYVFKELNRFAAGNALSVREIEIFGTRQELPVLQSIEAVEEQDIIRNTPAEELALPEELMVTFADGTACKAPVTWNLEDYDPAAEGQQTLTGTIQGEFLNSQDLKAQVVLNMQEEPVELTNIALQAPVEVSGREVEGRWPGSGITDGDKTNDESRWSSGLMKSGNTPGQEQTSQWAVVDLGAGKNTIHSIVTSFYRKVYATNYDVYVSNTGKEDDWTKVAHREELSDDQNLVNPADTIELEKPVEGRYVKFVYNSINVYAAGNALSVREVEIMGTHEDPVTTAITSVDALEALHVEHGTPAEELSLPEQAAVHLADGTTAQVDVNWNLNTYDPAQSGEQTLHGSLQLTEGLSNPDGLEAEITVVVAEPEPEIFNITYVEAVSAISVPFGTPAEELALPEAVKVTLSNGETRTLPVAWNLSSYKADQAGTLTVEGELSLDEDLANPDQLKASVQITVEEKILPKVIKIEKSADLHLSYAESFLSLSLPETLKGELDNGESRNLPVTWNLDAFVPGQSGEQTITGTVQIPEDVTTDLEKKVTVLITVDEEPVVDPSITEIEDIEDLPITAETFQISDLPQSVSALLDDGTRIDLPVTWKTDGLLEKIAAMQKKGETLTVEGTFSVPEGIQDVDNHTITMKLVLAEDVWTPADKSDLEDLLNQAAALKPEDYLQNEAFENFTQMHKNARDIHARDRAEQSEVDDAARNLKQAMAALEKKLDLSELKAALEEAEKINQKDFTEDSLKPFNQAMDDARALMEKDLGESDAEEVQKVLDALKKAQSDLKKKTAEPQKPADPKPEDPKKEDPKKDNPKKEETTSKPATAAATGVAAHAAAAGIGAVLLGWMKRRNRKNR